MTRNEIIQKARGKYVRLKGKAERSHFLSFFCEQTGIKRKYAQKLLSGKRDGSGKGRHEQQGRPRKYTPEDAEIIRTIWLRSGQPCSRRLKGTLNMWLKSYSKHVRILSQQEEERLGQISASQLDRILKSFRVEMPRTKSWLRGRSVESAGQPRDIRAENGGGECAGMDGNGLLGAVRRNLWELRAASEARGVLNGTLWTGIARRRYVVSLFCVAIPFGLRHDGRHEGFERSCLKTFQQGVFNVLTFWFNRILDVCRWLRQTVRKPTAGIHHPWHMLMGYKLHACS